MKIGEVVRGSIWLYLGGLSTNILGFVYWIVVSHYVSPSVVGSASAVLALYNLIAAIFSLGISVGLRRHIGISRGDNDSEMLGGFFFSSLALLTVINVPTIVVAMLMIAPLGGLVMLSTLELAFVVLFLIVGYWTPMLTSLFNSLLRTRTTATAHIASSVSKIMIGVVLLQLGYGFLGVVFGYLAAFIIVDMILLYRCRGLFNELGIRLNLRTDYAKEVLKAGMPSWIPFILTILGQSIGVLIIYASVGGNETGLYYVAFAIASVVYNIPLTIAILMLPILSGMKGGRRTAALRAIRLSSVVVIPISLSLIVYPYLPFIIIGSQYFPASELLQCLLLGVLIYPLVEGYNSYVYAEGLYRHVGVIALSLDLSRIVVYVILVPSLAALGVALAYSLGVLVALFVVLCSAHIVGFKLDFRQYVKVLFPIVIAFLIHVVELHWLIGIPLLLLLSLGFYARAGILTKVDMIGMAGAFLSDEWIGRLRPIARLFFRILYSE